MNYIKRLPENPSFKQNGLNGFSYDLESKELGLDVIDCFKGHDKYNTNIKSSHIYYVLEGKGRFNINNEIVDVKKDDCIEIPPNTEFVYAGEMKLLLIMNPAFCPQNGIDGKENDLY